MVRLLIALLLFRSFAVAHQAPSSPNASIGASLRATHDRARDFILRAAEQIPESDFAYRPTPDVRSVAQQLAHIADSQNYFCAVGLGVAQTAPTNIERTYTSKAAILEELRKSFSACEPAVSQSDADLLRPTGRTGDTSARLATLILNASHNFEHYGNLVTYMRLRGMVPPSSQP